MSPVEWHEHIVREVDGKGGPAGKSSAMRRKQAGIACRRHQVGVEPKNDICLGFRAFKLDTPQNSDRTVERHKLKIAVAVFLERRLNGRARTPV